MNEKPLQALGKKELSGGEGISAYGLQAAEIKRQRCIIRTDESIKGPLPISSLPSASPLFSSLHAAGGLFCLPAAPTETTRTSCDA